MCAWVVAAVGAVGERGAHLAGEKKLRVGICGAGLGPADALTGGVAHIGAIGIALPDGVGVIEATLALVMRVLEAHATEQAETVAEKRGVGLHVSGANGLSDELRPVDAGVALGEALRLGLGVE
jgi:hypothetical protein